MNTWVFKIFQGHVITDIYVFVLHSFLEAFPSQVLIFNNVRGNLQRRLGWDRGSRPRRVLDGVVSIGVDISTSTIWTEGWGWGGLGLATLDDPCLTFLSRRLGRLPRSKFFGRDFLLSPADERDGTSGQLSPVARWTWVWSSGRSPSPTTSFLLFSFIVAIPKKEKKKKRKSF